MIISANIIENPVLTHRCAACYKLITGRKIRVFGAAEEGDPPYAVYIHPYCATQEVEKALARESRGQSRGQT